MSAIVAGKEAVVGDPDRECVSLESYAIIILCCSDCCGFSEGPEQPYQMHVQTAGSSAGEKGGNKAELVIFCVNDLSKFRSQVRFGFPISLFQCDLSLRREFAPLKLSSYKPSPLRSAAISGHDAEA